MSKWAKLSELDSCFFAKACLSWSKLHSCTDMSRAFSEPRLSNFAHLSDSWVIQEYFVCDGSLSRLYLTKKKSLIGSLYRLGGSIRFGYCAIPCFGGLCEERLPCFRERVNGCCNGACGYCYAIRGPTHRGPKSGCKLVTLFDSYSDDGVSAVIGVQHTEVPNLGASWWRNLTVTLMMVWVLL